MDLSVVVPTLNGRERLARCLDGLAAHAPDAEVVVVNGPSTDGTTGMVRDREDVAVLVEVADRNVNTARNAGLDRASGDAVAFLDHDLVVEDGWRDGVESGLAEADAATGPTHQRLRAGVTTDSTETRTIKGREVTYFNGGNAAFSTDALDAADGFDEYLQTGGARDLAHRLAGLDRSVSWAPEMCVRGEFEPDGGVAATDWHWQYRSLAYRLTKNYGLRPTVAYRIVRHGLGDAASGLREVFGGDAPASSWLGNGRDVFSGTFKGLAGGLRARFGDRSPRRNPRGRSARGDRAVAVYDRR
jgi:glycosyltransferase involved in cell wall biosynthesis